MHMYMKKKLLPFLLLMLRPIAANAYDISATNADGVTIYYNYINDGKELEVARSPKDKYAGTIVIPAEVTIDNSALKVTSIGRSAFYGCSGLTSITIPESVNSIEYYAFYNCSGLKSITISEGVTIIGSYAFKGCTGLTSITIRGGVTSIGGSAFEGCTRLTSINIPSSVTSIGGSAFEGCTRLTSINIPS
ncbi:MAG: leucine-rich repeat domain-containing protein, partial [Bacteroidaceae bacterium]|nr:leucine-rich repeat domain-containing protein [Bacteroidaceae bacterium]